MGSSYLVKLSLHLGEYEKSKHALVRDADSEADAMEQALKGECHSDEAVLEDNTNNQIEDEVPGWAYKVIGITELLRTEYKTLKRLL